MEEDPVTHKYPCSTTIESGAHIERVREIAKEEQGVLTEENNKLNVCGMEEFGTLERR